MPGSPAAWSSAPGPLADWLSLTINSDFFDMFFGFNRYRASMSCIWNERNLAYLVFWCNKNILFVLPCLKLTNITPEKWAETQKERIVSHLAILRGDVSFREGIATTNLPSHCVCVCVFLLCIYIYIQSWLVSFSIYIFVAFPVCFSPGVCRPPHLERRPWKVGKRNTWVAHGPVSPEGSAWTDQRWMDQWVISPQYTNHL